MNRAALRCALSITLKDRIISDAEVAIIFKTGLALQHVNRISMSFPVYVLMADLARVFSIVEAPEYTGYCSKDEFLYRLEEMTIPHRLSTVAAKDIANSNVGGMVGFPSFVFGAISWDRFSQ